LQIPVSVLIKNFAWCTLIFYINFRNQKYYQRPIPARALCRLHLLPLPDGRYFPDLRLGQGRRVMGISALQGRIFDINK
jgi:hypothetical protein